MSATTGTSGFGTLFKRGDGGVGAGTQASRTVSTSNQQIIIYAKTAGTAGNSKTCSIVVSGNSTAFGISVTSSNVTITSATDGGGTATTTVGYAIAQLYLNSTFVANFQATTGAGNGSGVLVAAGSASLAGGANGTEVFATVAEVTNISGPGRSLELIDATHMESPDGYREYLPSLKDGGEISVDLNFLPGDTNQSGLLTDYENRTRRNFQLVFTNSPATTWSFGGYITDFEPSMQIDDKLSASVTIKVTGSITAS